MATKKPKLKKLSTGDHALAIAVSKIEGGKVNLSIAQIKEVIARLRELERINPLPKAPEQVVTGEPVKIEVPPPAAIPAGDIASEASAGETKSP